MPLSFILIQSMFNISVCATNDDDVLPHHHRCMKTSLLAEIFNVSVNSELPFPISIPEGKVSLSQQYLVPRSTYEWHCYSYDTPQGMEVLPTCLSLFPRDTRLLGSFSAAHDKGVLDYREGVPISPLKNISSSCPFPKESEARNLSR